MAKSTLVVLRAEDRGLWIAVLSVPTVVMGGGAVTMGVTLASHSAWELCVVVIFGLVGVVSFYMVLAGLLTAWPFRASDAPAPLKATDVIGPHLEMMNVHQGRLDTLTALLEEGNRRVADMVTRNREIVSDNSFYGSQLQEWTTRADDTIRRDFGSPNDALARNHQFGEAPPTIRDQDRKLWQEADRRRGWILDKLRTMAEKGPFG